MKHVALFSVAIAVLSLAGCNEPRTPTSDQRMNRAQEQLAAEAASQVGMPAIMNFQEKRMMKTILELRDQAISTTTYIVASQNGQLFKVCDSLGFGLPYATQYTNPQKIGYSASQVGVATLPQADPNGLFSPAAAEGTWVLCLDPSSKKDRPVYIEPKVIVSPFPIVLTPVPFATPAK